MTDEETVDRLKDLYRTYKQEVNPAPGDDILLRFTDQVMRQCVEAEDRLMMGPWREEMLQKAPPDKWKLLDENILLELTEELRGAYGLLFGWVSGEDFSRMTIGDILARVKDTEEIERAEESRRELLPHLGLWQHDRESFIPKLVSVRIDTPDDLGGWTVPPEVQAEVERLIKNEAVRLVPSTAAELQDRIREHLKELDRQTYLSSREQNGSQLTPPGFHGPTPAKTKPLVPGDVVRVTKRDANEGREGPVCQPYTSPDAIPIWFEDGVREYGIGDITPTGDKQDLTKLPPIAPVKARS